MVLISRVPDCLEYQGFAAYRESILVDQRWYWLSSAVGGSPTDQWDTLWEAMAG